MGAFFKNNFCLVLLQRMQITGIYIIRNSANGKVYIGSACNIYTRWRKHKSDLKRGIHHSRQLQNFVGKYGTECLSYQVLLCCNRARLLVWEQRSIDFFNAANRLHGFNTLPVAGSSLGVRHTKERKRANAARAKVRYQDPAEREKISAAMRGRSHSPETKAKMRLAKLGRTFTPEHRAAMSAARTGLKRTPKPLNLSL